MLALEDTSHCVVSYRIPDYVTVLGRRRGTGSLVHASRHGRTST